jgi:hypothetical protein
VNPELLRRQAVLAAIALLVALGLLALRQDAEPGRAAPAAAPEGAGSWQEVQVGVIRADALGQPTNCDIVLEAATVGIAHPVLPCGAQIVVAFGGKTAQAPVVARGGGVDLTPALAAALGVAGVQTVRWRFAESAG